MQSKSLKCNPDKTAFEQQLTTLMKQKNNKGQTPYQILFSVQHMLFDTQLYLHWLPMIETFDMSEQIVVDAFFPILYSLDKIDQTRKRSSASNYTNSIARLFGFGGSGGNEIQQFFDKFEHPQNAYKLLLKKAIDQKYLKEFEKYFKIEEYHQNAMNYFTLQKRLQKGLLSKMRANTIQSTTGNQEEEEIIKDVQLCIVEDHQSNRNSSEIQIKPISSEQRKKLNSLAAKKRQESSHLPEIILSFFIELLSSLDMILDIVVCIQMLDGGHIAWFCLTFLQMLGPYLVGYGSFVGIRINQILKNQKEENQETNGCQNIKQNLANVIMLTPLVIIYLIIIDAVYISSVVIVTPFLMMLKFISMNKVDILEIFDNKMNVCFQKMFYMSQMQVLGIRRQRTILQLAFETLPQFVLQVRMLVYFQDEKYKDELELVDVETLQLSILMAICHIILEMSLIYQEAVATNTSMQNYTIVCFNAREGWLPFASYFKTRNDHAQAIEKEKEEESEVGENKQNLIEYENIYSQVCCCKFGVHFHFSEYTAILLMKTISNLQRIKVYEYRPTLKLGKAFNSLDANLLIQFLTVAYERVNIEFTDIDLEHIMQTTTRYINQLQHPENNNEEETDFIKMVQCKYTDVVAMMIKLNAQTNIFSRQEKHPLHIAYSNKDSQMLDILVKAEKSETLKYLQLHYQKFIKKNKDKKTILIKSLFANAHLQVPYYYQQFMLKNKISDLYKRKGSEFDIMNGRLLQSILYGAHVPTIAYKSNEEIELNFIDQFQTFSSLYPKSVEVITANDFATFETALLCRFSEFRIFLFNQMKKEEIEKSNQQFEINVPFDISKYGYSLENLKQFHRLTRETHQTDSKFDAIEIHTIDEMVEALGLDKKRDQYFALSRQHLNEAEKYIYKKSFLKENQQTINLQSQLSRDGHKNDHYELWGYEVPRDVQAIKSITIDIKNLKCNNDSDTDAYLVIEKPYSIYQNELFYLKNQHNFKVSLEYEEDSEELIIQNQEEPEEQNDHHKKHEEENKDDNYKILNKEMKLIKQTQDEIKSLGISGKIEEKLGITKEDQSKYLQIMGDLVTDNLGITNNQNKAQLDQIREYYEWYNNNGGFDTNRIKQIQEQTGLTTNQVVEGLSGFMGKVKDINLNYQISGSKEQPPNEDQQQDIIKQEDIQINILSNSEVLQATLQKSGGYLQGIGEFGTNMIEKVSNLNYQQSLTKSITKEDQQQVDVQKSNQKQENDQIDLKQITEEVPDKNDVQEQGYFKGLGEMGSRMIEQVSTINYQSPIKQEQPTIEQQQEIRKQESQQIGLQEISEKLTEEDQVEDDQGDLKGFNDFSPKMMGTVSNLNYQSPIKTESVKQQLQQQNNGSNNLQQSPEQESPTKENFSSPQSYLKGLSGLGSYMKFGQANPSKQEQEEQESQSLSQQDESEEQTIEKQMSLRNQRTIQRTQSMTNQNPKQESGYLSGLGDYGSKMFGQLKANYPPDKQIQKDDINSQQQVQEEQKQKEEYPQQVTSQVSGYLSGLQGLGTRMFEKVQTQNNQEQPKIDETPRIIDQLQNSENKNELPKQSTTTAQPSSGDGYLSGLGGLGARFFGQSKSPNQDSSADHQKEGGDQEEEENNNNTDNNDKQIDSEQQNTGYGGYMKGLEGYGTRIVGQIKKTSEYVDIGKLNLQFYKAGQVKEEDNLSSDSSKEVQSAREIMNNQHPDHVLLSQTKRKTLRQDLEDGGDPYEYKYEISKFKALKDLLNSVRAGDKLTLVLQSNKKAMKVKYDQINIEMEFFRKLDGNDVDVNRQSDYFGSPKKNEIKNTNRQSQQKLLLQNGLDAIKEDLDSDNDGGLRQSIIHEFDGNNANQQRMETNEFFSQTGERPNKPQ